MPASSPPDQVLGCNKTEPDRLHDLLDQERLLRRKYQEPETSRSAIFSLNVRPLAELVSMYQDRDATDRRDKIFALLGMASDHVPPSLLPDYSISWPELFHRFICSQVGEQAAVEVSEGGNMAFVETSACALGYIYQTDDRGSWGALPLVGELDERPPPTNPQKKWILRGPTWLFQEGDVLCLLRGTRLPVVVRLSGPDASIIAIVPFPAWATEQIDRVRQVDSFPYSLRLVWEWSNGAPRSFPATYCALRSPTLAMPACRRKGW